MYVFNTIMFVTGKKLFLFYLLKVIFFNLKKILKQALWWKVSFITWCRKWFSLNAVLFPYLALSRLVMKNYYSIFLFVCTNIARDFPLQTKWTRTASYLRPIWLDKNITAIIWIVPGPSALCSLLLHNIFHHLKIIFCLLMWKINLSSYKNVRNKLFPLFLDFHETQN